MIGRAALVFLFVSNIQKMLRLKGNRSKASSMDVELNQDAYDQDLTDLTSSDASHMMCDPDLVDKVRFFIFETCLLLRVLDVHG
jgi:hypothetical protein